MAIHLLNDTQPLGRQRRQPPETGGNTATSSLSTTPSSRVVGSPFRQIVHVASTASKSDPKRSTAASMMSPTVEPANSSRRRPAASRADANNRIVAITKRYRRLSLHGVVSPILSHPPDTVTAIMLNVPIMLNVLFARHGQSEWNELGRWQGQADPPLSEFGIAQSTDAARHCGAFDAIISSNLQRASQTALTISEVTGIGPVLIEAAFSERNVGSYQGLTREEIDEQFPGQLEAGIWPEGWEPDEAVLQRVQQGLEGLLQHCGAGDVLVVAHGGVIYALERHFGDEYRRISNLEGRWLHHDGSSWHLGERVALTHKLASEKQDLIQ